MQVHLVVLVVEVPERQIHLVALVLEDKDMLVVLEILVHLILVQVVVVRVK